MKNRKTLIKLKRFALKIENLSNIELLEEYRNSSSNIDHDMKHGISNKTEYERNSIIQMHILNRMKDPNNCRKPPINREPKPTPAPPPKKGN